MLTRTSAKFVAPPRQRFAGCAARRGLTDSRPIEKSLARRPEASSLAQTPRAARSILHAHAPRTDRLAAPIGPFAGDVNDRSLGVFPRPQRNALVIAPAARNAAGMKLLVLGGTRFVGRAVVRAALDRGWDVTAIHRGITGTLPDGITVMHADRASEPALAAALGDGHWDAVIDTWSGVPVVAGIAARLLRDRAPRFGYVSSGSVYVWGEHVDERSPLVDGDPRAEGGDYPALKRGAELAVLEYFPDAILARAGLLLGPYEDIGRLPWWLDRISRGGRVVAPGRRERPLQYVDARDLAAWMLSALADGLT
ncbi:MAG: hypothetical protein QOG52_1974, partial [Frankiaceae bacterium]|nr:hypothetical protein [Frankiaceae bacterium]